MTEIFGGYFDRAGVGDVDKSTVKTYHDCGFGVLLSFWLYCERWMDSW